MMLFFLTYPRNIFYHYIDIPQLSQYILIILVIYCFVTYSSSIAHQLLREMTRNKQMRQCLSIDSDKHCLILLLLSKSK
jgi:hypothetical protein